MRVVVVAVLALVACGRFGFDTGGGADDGPPDDATDAPLIDAPPLVGTVTMVKASAPAAFDQFGHRVAVSADGGTIAVGAFGRAGIAGAVYVYEKTGSAWVEQQVITPANAAAGDAFGYAIALSADGNTLIVGAPDEDSGAVGVDGDGANDNLNDSGAAYVFTRAGSTWSQRAYLKASNTGQGDHFGEAVAVSGDGLTYVVGAWAEDAPLITDPGSNAATESGAVYVFRRASNTWSFEAYLKASSIGAGDIFGIEVALSLDGDRLAVSATGDDGQTGAVYVFSRAGTVWTEDAVLTASNPSGGDFFGYSISLTEDGNNLAITAEGEDGPGVGPYAAQGDGAGQAGALYLFDRGQGWSETAYVKATNTGAEDRYGRCVAYSGDGTRVVVGAPLEDSNGTPADDSVADAGAAYVYARAGAWMFERYLKASNIDLGDQHGGYVDASRTGNVIVIGAFHEDGPNDGIENSGAVYIYE